MAATGADASLLNGSNSNTYLRSVFELQVPDEMAYVTQGLRLRFDVATQPATGDWTNAESRTEMRTQQIDVAPVLGSTVAYCMTFTADHPDTHGPISIFQAFSRALDGPMLGIELTGVNQFSDATPNELQVVSVDGRHRISDAQLNRGGGANNLMVVIHYGQGGDGAYLVSLNGRTLRAVSGVNTWPGQGVWWQFGLYAHGMKSGSGPDIVNRRGQLESGATRFESVYQMVERVTYLPGQRDGGTDLGRFTTAS